MSQSRPFDWRGRPVRAILLDMDGTIADTKQAHGDAWVTWAARHNIPITREAYMRDFFGRSNEDVLPSLLPHLAGDRTALREAFMEKEHLFVQTMIDEGVPPTPGLLEFVARAESRGLPIAIASSAPRENVETLTAHYGLETTVKVRLSVDDVSRAKPDPELFVKAAGRLGIDPRDCVVFEDSRYGLQAAHAAGARAIAVLTLHTEEELSGEADLCISDFSALLESDQWRVF